MSSRAHTLAHLFVKSITGLAGLVWASWLAAAPAAPAAPASASSLVSAKAAVSEQGIRWNELKPAQQVVLAPLKQDWARIDGPRKMKWVEIAARFPKLSAEEQSRIQGRMVAWTKLTPQERGQARINFQEAKQLPAQDRKARWDAYQALTPEQRSQLAARAAPAASSASDALRSKPGAGSKAPSTTALPTKSNLVPSAASSPRPKPVSPTAVQVGPGATTTLMTKRPTPPSHQQSGMPKIAATPEFVNKTTLLPQRGPQSAASRPHSASEPAPAKRQ